MTLNDNINISTITMSCKLNKRIKLNKNILEKLRKTNIDVDDEIVFIKTFDGGLILNKNIKNNIVINTDPLPITKSKRKKYYFHYKLKDNLDKYNKHHYKKLVKKINSNLFANQSTIFLRLYYGDDKQQHIKDYYKSLLDNNYITDPKLMNVNVKIFKNKSLQITGCKDPNILTKIIDKFKKIFSPIKRKYKKLKIISQNIILINSNINVGYQINRDKLYKLLINDKTIELKYIPDTYAGIRLYLTINDNKIRFLIFQTGKIIISSAKTLVNLRLAYKYINDLMIKHKKIIEKRDNLKELFGKFITSHQH